MSEHQPRAAEQKKAFVSRRAPAGAGPRMDGAARHVAALVSGQAPLAPSTLAPRMLRMLQRTAGNAAVNQLLQRLAMQESPVPPVSTTALTGGPLQRSFELAKKEYYSQADIEANQKLTTFLRTRGLFEAAVALATADDSHTFKTESLLATYLQATYGDMIAAALGEKDKSKKVVADAEKLAASLSLTSGMPASSSSSSSMSTTHHYNQVNTWGHTFDANTHGPGMDGAPAIERAQEKKVDGACGVWLNVAAAQVLLTSIFKERYQPGTMLVIAATVPESVGVEYLANGEKRACTRIFCKFSPRGGYLTAFPTNQTEVHAIEQDEGADNNDTGGLTAEKPEKKEKKKKKPLPTPKSKQPLDDDDF